MLYPTQLFFKNEKEDLLTQPTYVGICCPTICTEKILKRSSSERRQSIHIRNSNLPSTLLVNMYTGVTTMEYSMELLQKAQNRARFLLLLSFSNYVVFCSLWLHGFQPPSFCFLHYLLEFAQAHIHWVSDAIPPSHPLSPPSPPTLSLLSIKFFSNELALCTRISECHLQHQSFQWISGLISFKIDWFDLLAAQWILKHLL